MKSILSLMCLLLMLTSFGCGGTPELPPSEGGTNSASQEEIQKQMKESMERAKGAYKGKLPTPGGQN
jgi:predicted small lipoprotein YifL